MHPTGMHSCYQLFLQIVVDVGSMTMDPPLHVNQPWCQLSFFSCTIPNIFGKFFIFTLTNLVNAVTDLTNGAVPQHKRVGGGWGRALSPSGSNFFHFHAVFGKKFAKKTGFCPKLRGWCPRLGNPGSTTAQFSFLSVTRMYSSRMRTTR